MTAPLPFRWDGEVMVPIGAKASERANEGFVVGERYVLVQHEERSEVSHSQYFAVLKEAWQNLPEGLVGEYPTPEHLRKRALIRTGYCDMTDIVAASREDAYKIAVRFRKADKYALVEVRGCVVRVYTAESQSRKAMSKGEFEKSKAKVLDWVSVLIGTSTDELSKARAA